MLVQDVIGGAYLCSGRRLETDVCNSAASDGKSVWLGRWLKPHNSLFIIFLVLVEDFAVERAKNLLISDTWNFHE